jgi:transketolase N-terminal domain/subunit
MPRGRLSVLGDGETAEGSVWEAVQLVAHDRVDQLVAIVDTGVHVQRLAVREIPRSGAPQKLLERYGSGGRGSLRPRGAS